MNKFPETYSLQRLDEEEIENPNRPITNHKNELVIIIIIIKTKQNKTPYQQTETQHQMASQTILWKHLKTS